MGKMGIKRSKPQRREGLPKPIRPLKKGNTQTDPEVVEFLKQLAHPLKPELEALRQIILDASPKIRECIKWNSPSFCTTDYFATINLRGRAGEERVWLILHTGVKVNGTAVKGLKIADPNGLLKWLAKDRCVVTFGDAKDVKAKGAALQSIVREWIRQI